MKCRAIKLDLTMEIQKHVSSGKWLIELLDRQETAILRRRKHFNSTYDCQPTTLRNGSRNMFVTSIFKLKTKTNLLR